MAEWISARHSAVRFVKNQKYTFYFPHQIEEMDENGIAVCNIHVEHGEGRKVKKMSCKWMDREEALRRMKDRNVNYFRPLVGFLQDERVLCVGHYIGLQLRDWVVGQTQSDLWRLDGVGKIIIAGPILMKLAREITKSLTECHQQQKKPLGFACSKLYVQNTSFMLSGPPDNQDVGDVAAIERDLKEFGAFIDLVATGDVTDRNMRLFKALFQISHSSNVEAVLIFSYFICHSPLFWSLTERNKFANAYDFIRKQFRNDFDAVFKMNYDIYRVDDWPSKVPALTGHPLRDVYDFSFSPSLPVPANRMLMQYIRYCYHHYFEKRNHFTFGDVDEELLRIFPFAFSATYGELA